MGRPLKFHVLQGTFLTLSPRTSVLFPVPHWGTFISSARALIMAALWTARLSLAACPELPPGWGPALEGGGLQLTSAVAQSTGNSVWGRKLGFPLAL